MKRLERRQSESARRDLETQMRREADEAARKARARGGNAVLLQVCQSEGFARLDDSAYAWLEHAAPILDREPSGQWASAR